MDIKPEPVRKIKINREIGKRISSIDRPISAEDSAHATGNGRVDKSRGKLRRKVHAPDGSESILVDYTPGEVILNIKLLDNLYFLLICTINLFMFVVFCSTSSTGGSPINKHEDKLDLKKTVVKTLEEYTNDSSTPAEDEIVMIQVPRSKWEKEDYESEDDESKIATRTGSINTSSSAPSGENTAVKSAGKESPHADKAPPVSKEADLKPAKDSTSVDKEKDTDKEKDRDRERERDRGKEKDRSSTADREITDKRKPIVPNQDKEHAQEKGSDHGSERSSSSQSSRDRQPDRPETTSRKPAGREATTGIPSRKTEHRDDARDHLGTRSKDERNPIRRRVSPTPPQG